MIINGNYLINSLYFCEKSKEIQRIEKELNIDKPILDKEFKEDGYTSIVSQKTNSEIFFSDIKYFNKNIDKNLHCDILFSSIVLQYKTTIPLPFSLKMNDSLDLVIEKIGKKPNYMNNHWPSKTWHLKRHDGKDYLLYALFDKDDYRELINLTISTYDDSIDILNNKHHTKLQ